MGGVVGRVFVETSAEGIGFIGGIIGAVVSVGIVGVEVGGVVGVEVVGVGVGVGVVFCVVVDVTDP